MSERVVSRPLGTIEAGMAIGNRLAPLNMVTVVRLAAAPDPDRLRSTIDELQRRHPPLRARVIRRRGRLRFVYDVEQPITLDIVERRSPSSWIDEVERLLNTALPAGGPLAHAVLVRANGDGRSELIVAFQHTIVDGVSAATLWGELLAVYATAADGSIERRPSRPTPHSADELLPDKARGWRSVRSRLGFLARSLSAEARYRRSTRGRAPAVDRRSRTQVSSHTFDQATTNRLNRAVRNHRCTLHSLLHTAVLLAVHRSRYDGTELQMRTIAFADLRPHLEPAADPGDLAPYISLTSQDVAAGPVADIWTLVPDVQRELRATVKGTAKYDAYAFGRRLMQVATAMPRLRMATTAVSHTGPIRIEGSDGVLPVDDVHAFVSNLPIGPEISIRSGSYAGRLTLDMMTLDTDMDRGAMAALAALIVDQLDAVARAG